MKRSIILTLLPLICTGCGLTRIVTVSPDFHSPKTYSTVVTVPSTRTVTTTTRVTPATNDISLCLDLQAVGAAFAQSSTVRDFEYLLNNSSYMLSNLDLNSDGYVDYLRVMETIQGYAHVFLIQAVLAPDVYQDVATVVAEVGGYAASPCVQVIGSTYIYGPNFIVQPVFVLTPAIYAHLMRPAYVPWRSPWHWNHYPSCYRHPSPVFYSHYHAYIGTYMRNHRYCHDFSYAPSCHYPDYERVSRNDMRNDYGVQHPERSFVVRNADIATSRSATTSTVNARNVREAQESSARTTVSTTGRGTSASSPSRSATAPSQPSRSASTLSQPSRSATVQSQPSRSATVQSQPSRSATTSSTTTVKSRVSASGTSNTRVRTVDESGTRTSTGRGTSSSSPTRR